jgi:hypothetical protein
MKTNPPINLLRLAFLILLLCVALFIAISSYVGLTAYSWSGTHWLFSYEHGFIKRGLVGTVYQHFQIPVSLRGIALVGNVAALLVTLLLVYTVARSLFPTHKLSKTNAEPHSTPSATSSQDTNSQNLDTTEDKAGRQMTIACFIGLWLLTGPGLIQQWFFDLGRFDVFAALFLLLSLVVTASAKKYVSLAFIFFASLSSVMIHEVFFFWTPWVMMAIWLIFNAPTSKDAKVLGIGIFVLTLSVGFIGNSNYGSRLPLEDAKAELSVKADFDVVEGSLMVHYRGIADNLELTFRVASAQGASGWLGVVLSAALLFPYFYLIQLFSRYAYQRSEISLTILFLVVTSPLIPIFVFLMGIDYGRWLSMINVGSVLVLLAFVWRFPRVLERVPLGIAATLGCLSVIQVSVGPFGIEYVLPELPWHLVDRVIQ